MRALRSLLALAASILAASLSAASAPNASSSALNDVVALPEFKVYDSRPLPEREKWDFVRVGHFEILSNTSKSVTKRFAEDLSQFQNVLEIVAPHMLIRAEQPVMVVLVGKDNASAAFEVKAVIPSTAGRATAMVRDNEIASIIVDYQRRDVPPLSPVGPQMLGAGGIPWYDDWYYGERIHTAEEFIRQYVHLSLSQMNPRPAAWVAEGLADIYSHIEYSDKWIEIGRPYWKRNMEDYSTVLSAASQVSASTGSDGLSTWDPYTTAFNNYNTQTGLNASAVPVSRLAFYIMPMAKMLAVTYDSPLLSGSGRSVDATAPNWRTQAAAFVHLCLYGENGKFRQGFLKFSSLVATQPPTEELFKQCFGMSYRDMEFELRSYVDFTNYKSLIIEANKGYTVLDPKAKVEVRPANDAEIGRIKGETFRLSGHEEAASREFVTAYLRGERDPQLLASLGLMARLKQDDARARTYLEAVAASAGVIPRPRAYLELARLRGASFTAANQGRPYTLEQMSAQLQPLFTAQQLPQQLLDIYLEIANVWEHSAVTPSRENLAALEYGIRLFPFSGELIVRTAALLLKHGHKSDAGAIIQRALPLTRDPGLKSRLEALRRQIDGSVSSAPSARFSPEASLGPELRQRLTVYRSGRAAALAEIRAKLEATASAAPARRAETLTAFAAEQGPRLRALEADGARLEADLGWPPDDGDDYAPALATVGVGLDAAARKDLTLLAATLQRPQNLSPPQIGLLRELFLDLTTDAAARGAFLFFSPDTARLRLPRSLPPELTAQVAAYTRDKDALKAELRAALAAAETLDSDVARSFSLTALAQQQAPRFTALEKQAEDIRIALAALPASARRPLAEAGPTLPPALAARLTEYQRKRSELQQNSRRDLRAIRASLPASSGAELVASGDGSRLSLRLPAGAPPELVAKRAAVDAFNTEYAARAEELNREHTELRRLLAEVAKSGSPAASGKSVSDLIQDFTAAAVRQASAETYRDCRAAVLQPGLSAEQRRLLFARTGEKQPAFVVEF